MKLSVFILVCGLFSLGSVQAAKADTAIVKVNFIAFGASDAWNLSIGSNIVVTQRPDQTYSAGVAGDNFNSVTCNNADDALICTGQVLAERTANGINYVVIGSQNMKAVLTYTVEGSTEKTVTIQHSARGILN